MNHKEALQEIVDIAVKTTLVGCLYKIYDIATEALQSESEKTLTELWGIKEQPKTEEVERGWTITDKTLIDRQLEAIKTVMGNIKTKEQAIQFLKDAGIELEEEQPTPPSIEKMAELRYPLVHRDIEDYENEKCVSLRYAFIEGYKANNSLEELEKWVKAYGITNHVHREDLLNKIQELKTLKP
jgi:hypothetical protein